MIFSGRPLRRLAGATSRLRVWKEEKEEEQKEEEKYSVATGNRIEAE